jgi:hypothetical protein
LAAMLELPAWSHLLLRGCAVFLARKNTLGYIGQRLAFDRPRPTLSGWHSIRSGSRVGARAGSSVTWQQ